MNATILLVEEKLAAKRITTAMHDAGVNARVEVICDAAEAVAYCKGVGEFADRGRFPAPDLVMVDANLTGGTGFDVLKTIRTESSFKHSVVIVLSSSRHLSDVASAYSFGASAFVVKPADQVALKNLVQTLTTFWLTQNVPPPVI